MISPLSRLASSKESLVFPAPVGPDITTTFCLSLIILRRRRGGGGEESSGVAEAAGLQCRAEEQRFGAGRSES